MATLNGYDYFELENSPRHRCDEHGRRCTRRFWVQTDNWEDLVRNLMGTHTVTYDANDNPDVDWVNRALPLPGGWKNCFCQAVDVEPLQPDSPLGTQVGVDLLRNVLATYGNGQIVTAEYDTRFVVDAREAHYKLTANLQSPGTYIRYEVDFGGEVLLSGDGTFHWYGESDDAKKVINGLQPGIVVPSAIHMVTWTPVIAPPWTKFRQFAGRVNENAFLGASAGDLLFLGAQARPIPRFQRGGAVGAAERTYYQIDLRFAEQVKLLADGTTSGDSWNKLYKADAVSGEHWVKIVDVDNNPPHKTSAFPSLFIYGK